MKNYKSYFPSSKVGKIISLISLLLFSLLFLEMRSSNIKMNKDITDINERVGLFLDTQLQENQLPGVQYVLFDQHKIIYEYNGGMADVLKGKKVKPESLMNVFSTTKVITAIAILQLAEKKQLSLSDNIQKYIPDTPYKNVTILNVLSHSSGIPDPILGNFYIHWSDEHSTYDQDKLLKTAMLDNAELDFEPGKENLYSNLGYAILGKIIENVSGLKYEKYIEKHIFQALKLNDKEINFGDQLQDNTARPYYKSTSIIYNIMVFFLKNRKTKNEGKWTSIDKPFYFNFPSHGGIVASAREYSKIFRDLLSLKPKILTSDSINMMFTEQSHYKNRVLAVSWFKDNMNGTPYLFHQGGGMGYISEVRLYPEKNLGSILLINRSYMKPISILSTLDMEFIKLRE